MLQLSTVPNCPEPEYACVVTQRILVSPRTEGRSFRHGALNPTTTDLVSLTSLGQGVPAQQL